MRTLYYRVNASQFSQLLTKAIAWYEDQTDPPNLKSVSTHLALIKERADSWPGSEGYITQSLELILRKAGVNAGIGTVTTVESSQVIG